MCNMEFDINANERERCSAQQLAEVRGIVPRP